MPQTIKSRLGTERERNFLAEEASRRLLLRRERQSDAGLLDFIPRVSPHLEPPRHLEPYVRELETAMGRDLRLVVAAPPQHGKSETTVHALVWWMLRRRARRHAYVTYAQHRSNRVSVKTRTLAESAGMTVEGPMTGWTVDNGSGCVFTSIGGPLTGEGIDGVAVVDDPVKDRAEAESAAYRERAIDWFDDVLMTRCHPGAGCIVMATRWHPEDLSGVLIGRGWRYLNLQAICEDPATDPIGRAAGEALWPSKRPLSFLAERQRNAYTFASLYQGNPRPRGGAVFDEPGRYTELPTVQGRVTVGYGLDLAYSAKKHSDWSVLAEVWRLDLPAQPGKPRPLPVFYVAHIERRQERAPQFRERVKLAVSRRPGPVRWYASGTEAGVADLLGVPRLEVIQPRDDKFVRALPIAEAWNDGRVLVPMTAQWLADFLAIVLGFTGVNDAHDDDVDALAAAFDVVNKPRPNLSDVPDLGGVSVSY